MAEANPFTHAEGEFPFELINPPGKVKFVTNAYVQSDLNLDKGSAIDRGVFLIVNPGTTEASGYSGFYSPHCMTAGLSGGSLAQLRDLYTEHKQNPITNLPEAENSVPVMEATDIHTAEQTEALVNLTRWNDFAGFLLGSSAARIRKLSPPALKMQGDPVKTIDKMGLPVEVTVDFVNDVPISRVRLDIGKLRVITEITLFPPQEIFEMEFHSPDPNTVFFQPVKTELPDLLKQNELFRIWTLATTIKTFAEIWENEVVRLLNA